MVIRLSVAMTNYNHGRFLEERIRSILEQLTAEDEFVIVDDASTDDSVAIIQRFVDQDPRVRLICNSQNRGVIPSANYAFQESRGEYLASLSADDRILPGFIEKTMNVLLQHPEGVLCCSDCAMWYDGFPDRDPQKIEITQLIPEVKTVSIFPQKKMFHIFYTTSFWIPGHTTIVRRDLVLKYGGLDERLGYMCDWFLLHSIAFRHGAAYIPEALSLWRQDSQSYSRQLSVDPKRIAELQNNIFKILCEKKNADLRSPFRASGLRLLQYYVRKRFWWLFARPIYWDFLIFFARKVVMNRWKLYKKSIFKRDLCLNRST